MERDVKERERRDFKWCFVRRDDEKMRVAISRGGREK